MTVKTSGKELKIFFKDPIWDEAFYDDTLFRVNGKELGNDSFDPEAINDTDVIEWEGGYLDNHPKYETLEELFRAYRKKGTTQRVVVEVPREKREELSELVAKLGGTIL